MDWDSADKIGLDELASIQVFNHGEMPEMVAPGDDDDPVGKGYQDNIPLCVFHWVLRRFMNATKYCLVSGCPSMADGRTAVTR